MVITESLTGTFAVFFVSAVVIAVFGSWLTKAADEFADISGLGEAITGAILLGAMTSLPGIITSVTAAWSGYPNLAISNAMGGIAVQTAFLPIADFVLRRSNLEHAAASLTNLASGCILVALLSLVLLAQFTPNIAIFGVHFFSPIILVFYLFGQRVCSQIQKEPMWGPIHTRETITDELSVREHSVRRIIAKLGQLFGLGGIVGFAGYMVALTGIELTERTHLSEGIVGALFTAIATSLPELVTTVAAVRHGALTLAVAGILGGNSFDVLFAVFADIAYRDGSIYHTMQQQQSFTATVTLLMTAIVLLGLLRREKHGVANIGFEGFLLLTVYFGSVAILVAGS